MSQQTSVELSNGSPEHTLGSRAVVKRKRGRPSKQTEARFGESSELLNTAAEHSLRKRASVTASSCEQQRGGYNEVRESTDGVGITLDELRKTDSGRFTKKPPVTIASVGRRRYRYHRCVECGKKAIQDTEGEYGCVQHPDPDTKATYRLRVLLKHEDICMRSTAFADVAENILSVSVEDFETLNDVG